MSKFNKDKLKDLEIRLSHIISRLTGINYLEFNIKIVNRRRNDPNDYLVVTSNDLSDYMYPKMFKTLKIVEFGGNWSDLKTTYWLPLNYTYEHHDGGTNGCSVAYIWINSECEIVRYTDVKENVTYEPKIYNI